MKVTITFELDDDAPEAEQVEFQRMVPLMLARLAGTESESMPVSPSETAQARRQEEKKARRREYARDYQRRRAAKKRAEAEAAAAAAREYLTTAS